jgi:hypothetical protein
LERASRRRGLTLIGYVDTDYGRRPRADVEKDRGDVDVAVSGALRGIFFDQQPSGPDALDYFVALRRAVWARIPGAPLVVTNRGRLRRRVRFPARRRCRLHLREPGRL